MTLEFARHLALARLEAEAAGSKYSDYDDAIKLLVADFAAHPIEKAPQSQDSVSDQLRRLVPIANNAGLYDAADHITQHLEICEKRAERRNKLREIGQSPKED